MRVKNALLRLDECHSHYKIDVRGTPSEVNEVLYKTAASSTSDHHIIGRFTRCAWKIYFNHDGATRTKSDVERTIQHLVNKTSANIKQRSFTEVIRATASQEI
jgi:hypothetical protein